MKKAVLFILFLAFGAGAARAQFADCSTGLLQMPTAEMQPDGTFMITNNYLNKHSLSSAWGYDTFQYGFTITFWSRVEVSYVCTILDGKRKPKPSERDMLMFNQDRHFSGRLQVLKEGEFGLAWMPALVVGISDPTTGAVSGNYIDADITKGNNTFFNRNFIVLSKNIPTAWGGVGVHAGYQFNWRRDYRIKAPCVGVNWRPVWLDDRWILDSVNLIAEYDSRTPNVGFIASIWDNRFEAMFEVQNFRWVNFGLRFKLGLLK